MTETEPRLLIIETSGRVGQVALALGPDLLTVRRLDETRRHARDLAPAVANLLAGQGWRPRDLHGVVVSRGPGSYTGLRVGIISAKTLAYATGLALIGVDTFLAVAHQAPRAVARFDVIADAQQDKIYVQRFSRVDPEAPAIAESPLRIATFTQWHADLGEGVHITGPGLGVFGSRVPAEIQVADRSWDPQPESLLRTGLARFLRGERDDAWTLEPLYLRPSSAEEKWRASGSG